MLSCAQSRVQSANRIRSLMCQTIRAAFLVFRIAQIQVGYAHMRVDGHTRPASLSQILRVCFLEYFHGDALVCRLIFI